MKRNIVRFFDRLEDHIHAGLSHRPIIYALIGGVGAVLFWKGVWETAEYFPILYGPASILIGIIILLSTGLIVSVFIGDSVIIKGLSHEEHIAHKTEAEVFAGRTTMEYLAGRLDAIEALLSKRSSHE